MTEEQLPKIVAPLDIKDEARPHSLTGGDIAWKQPHPFPPAAESVAACVELGLLYHDGQEVKATSAHGMAMQWAGMGIVEIKQLVAAIWPDMPDTGVQWSDVMERANRAAAALRNATFD